MEFTVQCITKKEMRNNPVSPIVNFLPMEEVKNCLNVIVQKLNVEFWSANLRYYQSKICFVKCFYAIVTIFLIQQLNNPVVYLLKYHLRLQCSPLRKFH